MQFSEWHESVGQSQETRTNENAIRHKKSNAN